MSKMKATYVGRDGSLDYRTGETYLLDVRYGWKPLHGWALLIRRRDGSGVCPYESVDAFLRCWCPEKQL